jgi:hypothetical protein
MESAYYYANRSKADSHYPWIFFKKKLCIIILLAIGFLSSSMTHQPTIRIHMCHVNYMVYGSASCYIMLLLDYEIINSSVLSLSTLLVYIYIRACAGHKHSITAFLLHASSHFQDHLIFQGLCFSLSSSFLHS